MSEKNVLTKKQESVYKFIRKSILKNHCGPTLREIQERFGHHSMSAGLGHLHALERKGWIKREKNNARAIKLMHESVKIVELVHD